MFGSLSLVTVRQEQNESAHPRPLYVGGSDELVDDDLCAVCKISELGLPERQGPGLRQAVPVFETETRGLRQKTVVHLEA